MDYRLVFSYSCWSFILICFCSSQSGALAEDQKLLISFDWLEDSEDALCRPIGDIFLRLFWFMVRMYKRCEEPQMAQYYFIKCREKLIRFNEDDDQSGNCTIRVELTNQKDDGLHYSDVCAQARRLFESGRDRDHVVSVLLGHYFPCKQLTRMNIRGVAKALIYFFERVLHSLGQSPTFSDEDTTLFLLTAFYSLN
ncbi:hypothetical protein DD237_001108 [Peronospora effusa]|uniref:Uncharacterized protein n=1 Tax=Peronospora effusa TaxID=542832 RepID=A0A425CJU7_9STRA|nr:hypothetical protein DD237_001108 [Peronospora effusa]